MKHLLVLVVALSTVAAVSCKKKDGDKPAGTTADKPVADKPVADKPVADKAPPAAEVKLVPLDLSPVGEDWKGWSVNAPEGATVKESFGAAEIVLGTGFQLDINLAKADVASYRKESEANDLNKVKGYVLDQPDVILYESEVMSQNEFHLYGGVKSGDVDFTCEDVKGPRHTKADVELMWKTCQSIAKK